MSPGLDKNCAVLECQIFQARSQAIQAKQHHVVQKSQQDGGESAGSMYGAVAGVCLEPTALIFEPSALIFGNACVLQQER